jgi:hypothetical protein
MRCQLADVDIFGMLIASRFAREIPKFYGEASAAMSCQISLGISVDPPLEGLLG